MNRDTIAELLVRHGVVATPQRVDIAEHMLARPQHLSADDVLAAMRARSAQVSKATVYNTLSLFCAHGLLRAVEVDPARIYYDSTCEPHHHFFNVDTGELVDIPLDAVELNVHAAPPRGTRQEAIDVVVRVRNV